MYIVFTIRSAKAEGVVCVVDIDAFTWKEKGSLVSNVKVAPLQPPNFPLHG